MKKKHFYALILWAGMTTFTFAQKVNLDVKQTKLETIFSSITKQTGYTFAYSTSIVNPNKKITISSIDEDLSSFLKKLCSHENFSFEIKNKKIFLTEKKEANTGNIGKSRKITGRVTDPTGESVIGANVVVEGTATGTITDFDGNFSLEIPDGGKLKLSYIGLSELIVETNGKDFLDIKMQDNSKALDEVVVTALGIKRSEKALGYSVQKVNPETLVSSKGVNVATSLTGKVAGLNIKNSTEFNETPSIKLRGENPILIIDGIPYGNMTLNDIAADDIESIDILKGATASALYGARGTSGAIMVTTKRGATNEGLDVSVNSNTMFFSGYLAFPEVQSSYSRGFGGKYNDDFVWGDKLDIGRTAVQYDPYTFEWREMPLESKGKNNFNNFLEFSVVTNNNISIAQKGKYGNFRTSLTYVFNKGQYPNQSLDKFTYTVGGEIQKGNFSLDASATYNKRITSNQNGSGYSSSYIYDMVIWGGTEYDVRDYKNYWVAGKEDQQQNWYDNSWYDNPYFKAYEVIDSYDTDVLNASLNTSYKFTPWLKAIGRIGYDFYSKENEWRNAMSANYSWHKKGFYGISRNSGYSINTDAMLMADYKWKDLYIDALVGGNIYYYSDETMRSTTSNGLTVPGFYSLNASADPVKAGKTIYRKRVNSIYSKLSLAWASTYFIDITARNDWSSTLSRNTRSYLYPSIAGSVVLSEIITLPDFWDFMKIRASWTTSKQDDSVYANNNVYTINPNVWDGFGTASYPTSIIGNDLRPKKSEVIEIGTAVNFLKNRLNLDFAYYRKIESDFIISGGVSSSTGFNSIQTNFKEERLRQGYELTVGGTPVETKNFTWNIATNWGHDKYSYLKLDPEYSTKRPWVKEGESWDWMEIYDWERDPEGNIIHNAGIPVKQNFKSKVGDLAPKLVWGITNSLRYKDFNLSFTIDGRIGGLSFSRTHQMLWNSGVHIDSDNQWRYDEVVNGKLTYIGQGVKVLSGKVERDADGNIISDTRVFAPNDQIVSYESYIRSYHDSASKPSRQNVLSETFFKLRDVTLTYNIPSFIAQKAKMKLASVSLTGQNLFLWAKEYKYADPDKGGDSSGYENLNAPSQRYIGFNIKATF